MIASKILLLNIGEIFYILHQLFPEVAEKFVQTVFNLSKQTGGINIIALLFSVYFSKDFFISLNRAFFYITGKHNKPRFDLYLMALSLPIVLTLVVVLYLIKLTLGLVLSYFSKLVLHLNILFGEVLTKLIHDTVLEIYKLLFLNYLFEVFVLFSFICSGYIFLTGFKKSSRRRIFTVSVVLSILIVMIKVVFEELASLAFSKSPMFLIMGSVFIVIVWLKTMFDIILIGARFLYYLEKASEPGGLKS